MEYENMTLDMLGNDENVNNKKDRIKEYISFKKSAKVMQSKDIWSVKGDIYLPCATQNEIDVEEAKKIIEEKTAKYKDIDILPNKQCLYSL